MNIQGAAPAVALSVAVKPAKQASYELVFSCDAVSALALSASSFARRKARSFAVLAATESRSFCRSLRACSLRRSDSLKSFCALRLAASLRELAEPAMEALLVGLVLRQSGLEMALGYETNDQQSISLLILEPLYHN
jgi:hypothetical protein